MAYGLPYKGSKQAICKWLFNQLPPAENFYDLFGGGGAVALTLPALQETIKISITTNSTGIFTKVLKTQ